LRPKDFSRGGKAAVKKSVLVGSYFLHANWAESQQMNGWKIMDNGLDRPGRASL
jgi:hypothetical protein